MDAIRTGGCLCGAVRYELEGEPFLVGLCHCLDCRKASGSVFVAYAKWPFEQFSYSGEVKTFMGRSFCPICGSHLFNLHPPMDVELRIGTLDDGPTGLVPEQEGWTKRREHWLAPLAGVPQYEEDTAR
jgi:hypothetical protein